MFNDLLKLAKNELNIIEIRNKSHRRSQLIIGEMHFLPLAQCEELKTLISLKEKLDIKLVGTESLKNMSALPSDFNVQRALKNVNYMRELLLKKINAVKVFHHIYPETITEFVDDPRLRELAGCIDRRYYELFLLKNKKRWSNLTKEEKLQYYYWLDLLKRVLLKDRSDFMVRNLYQKQCRLNVKIGILICGAAHTPYRKEYRPYSVSIFLKSLPINYIIATLPSVPKFLSLKDSFDFYTQSDETEVNPYEIPNN